VTGDLPRALGPPPGRARVRSTPEDFQVREQLGFELSGDGEHAFLYLEKRALNSLDLLERVAKLAGVHRREVGISGMKDRNAVTSQWFSVGLAGRDEPDWRQLEDEGDVKVLEVGRHRRKLRRGVHRANRFCLRLRQLEADRGPLEQRLEQVRRSGVPNYFGEQRFGRNGSTLAQARHWSERGGRRISHNKRSLYLSALRAEVFNRLLAERVSECSWDRVLEGDMCMLAGTRSQFQCRQVDADIEARARSGDLHPALPLWGRGDAEVPAAQEAVCRFLEQAGLELAWRATRAVPDDFCWRFCDDDSLQLDFALGAGSYATALLAELVQYQEERNTGSDKGSE
jgi:tRNA pseudouridine13 synthase